MPLLTGQQQALGQVCEVFVQANHFIASGHELTLRIHDNQNRRVTALCHYLQHLLRQRQNAGRPQCCAIRDTDHSDGNALLALTAADNQTHRAGLHVMAERKQAFENFIERHGWLP
jgi:hypothetical protein